MTITENHGPHFTPPRRTVVGIGEALFDCFKDREVLGGAPVNVVVHADRILRRAGGRALPVTRIGADRLGERFREELSERGIDLGYAQVDPSRPTGRVDIRLTDSGDAVYDFQKNSAWDAIAFGEPLSALAEGCQAVVFGTLGQRHPESRDTIRRFLRRATGALRVLDVNLRQNFFDAEVLDTSFQLASAAKLNREEIDQVSELVGLDRDEVGNLAQELARRYTLDWVAVTDGPSGVTLYRNGQAYQAAVPAFDVQEKADTVGAGDACCAALICGSLLGWGDERTVAFANLLGAYVATRQGATPEIPEDLIQPQAGSPERSLA